MPFPIETNWEIPLRLNVSILRKNFKSWCEIFSFIDLKIKCYRIIPITDKVSDLFSALLSLHPATPSVVDLTSVETFERTSSDKVRSDSRDKYLVLCIHLV